MHAVMVAVADSGKPKFNLTRQPVSKLGGISPAQERTTNQDPIIVNLDRRVRGNDLHSMMGQPMKRMDQIQGFPNAENQQPNRRPNRKERGSQVNKKQQGLANAPKHFAGKGISGRATKQSFVPGHSSDEEDCDGTLEQITHRACTASFVYKDNSEPSKALQIWFSSITSRQDPVEGSQGTMRCWS
jgi:hypothetical protein